MSPSGLHADDHFLTGSPHGLPAAQLRRGLVSLPQLLLKHSHTAGSGIQPVNSEGGHSGCSTHVLAEGDALGAPLPHGTPPPSPARKQMARWLSPCPGAAGTVLCLLHTADCASASAPSPVFAFLLDWEDKAL